jgi:hypothetical protein
VSAEERARLRAAGRAKGAGLPQISPETYRRIAELLRVPVNQFMKELVSDVHWHPEVPAGQRPAVVKKQLYADRWPPKSMDADQLSDVLQEASLLLQTLRVGMSPEAAVAVVASARRVREQYR